jgi:hypothetical protein
LYLRETEMRNGINSGPRSQRGWLRRRYIPQSKLRDTGKRFSPIHLSRQIPTANRICLPKNANFRIADNRRGMPRVPRSLLWITLLVLLLPVDLLLTL